MWLPLKIGSVEDRSIWDLTMLQTRVCSSSVRSRCFSVPAYFSWKSWQRLSSGLARMYEQAYHAASYRAIRRDAA